MGDAAYADGRPAFDKLLRVMEIISKEAANRRNALQSVRLTEVEYPVPHCWSSFVSKDTCQDIEHLNREISQFCYPQVGVTNKIQIPTVLGEYDIPPIRWARTPNHFAAHLCNPRTQEQVANQVQVFGPPSNSGVLLFIHTQNAIIEILKLPIPIPFSDESSRIPGEMKSRGLQVLTTTLTNIAMFSKAQGISKLPYFPNWSKDEFLDFESIESALRAFVLTYIEIGGRFLEQQPLGFRLGNAQQAATMIMATATPEQIEILDSMTPAELRLFLLRVTLFRGSLFPAIQQAIANALQDPPEDD
jgi:hypothetical protein